MYFNLESKSELKWMNVGQVIEPQINHQGFHAWTFDPTFPLDVNYFCFAQQDNSQFLNRKTRHDYFELLYFHEGCAKYQIEERNFSVTAGDLLVINGMHPHSIQEIPAAGVKAVALYFLPDFVRARDTDGDKYLMPFLTQDQDFPYHIEAATGVPAKIFALIEAVSPLILGADDHVRLTAKTYLKMILALLGEYYATLGCGSQGNSRVPPQHQEADRKLQPLFKYLETHCHEPITVQQAARIARLSNSYFMRFFKQATGQSFTAYLHRLRIAKAEMLLTHTDKSIAEVSHDVGYCDQSYFSLVFRKLTHTTPRQFKYRSEVRQGNGSLLARQETPLRHCIE